jgi:L-arginine dehydrogenase
VNPEPPRASPVVLGAEAIDALLPRIDVLAVMRELFGALAASQAVQPPQSLTLFPHGAGDFITYLGALAGPGVFGAKLSPCLVRPQGALVTAWTLLLSMRDGQPVALLDSGRLTTERTAATTALAVDLLARRDARRLAVIGTGAVGRAHLRHVRDLRPWVGIRAHSRSLSARPDRQAALRAIDERIAIAGTLEEAVAGADVVLLCTSSGTSVLDPGSLDRPALITSISTNVAQAHEVTPAAIPRMEVYCDYRATTPAVAGELQLAAARHGWSPDAVRGDLPGLVAGRVPRASGERTVFFRSVGLGLEDIALAHAVVEEHSRSGSVP